MAAYLLLVLAVLSRVVPFPGMNFTAVGAGLLFFGARRPLKEMALPVLALMATDFYLTMFVYHYAWHTGAYLVTWAWYAGVILLGRLLLRKQITVTRVVAAPVASATSFFLVSNFSVWAAGTTYPLTLGGLEACYAAGLPFYRNDLLATTAITAVAFGGLAVQAAALRARTRTA